MQKNDKDELSTLVIHELKELGVKYKEKKIKLIQNKSCQKRIFHTHLHLLQLTDVFLANGEVVQVPLFLADACNRILDQVETEGIFRKAGSSIRQKEIRQNLEAGLPLGKSHHIIDVANVVKFFFRELPEPLIPTSMHETLLRSFLIGDNHVKAILLACLLLPPLTINTLSFFMQFLYTVSINAHANKMTSGNLAIVFTPGLMPLHNINSLRFNNHVKMVQLLIENANAIGTIPTRISDRLKISEPTSVLQTPMTKSQTTNMQNSQSSSHEIGLQKRKKKRRSGSLTQMFNGLRKIVGSAIGSAENLDNSTEDKMLDSCNKVNSKNQQHKLPQITTPCISKSSKKRKFADPVCAFSAKKKKDLLALLPSNSGGILPNTPLTKETKKSRLSLGGNRHNKQSAINPLVASMERRWSIVGTGWAKQKHKNSKENTAKENSESNECIFEPKSTAEISKTSPVFSSDKEPMRKILQSTDENCISISRNEYEAIKERVVAIETRISQEFGSIRKSLSEGRISLTPERCDSGMSGPDLVQNKYERVVEETELLNSSTTEHLAQRLNRGLKIRHSSEHRVMRSPSARKIGTIRRRSQEKGVRLSRNPTWHISSASNQISTTLKENADTLTNSFYAKSNLKRGRPNTLNSGLHTPVIEQPSDRPTDKQSSLDKSELWTPAVTFFTDLPTKCTAKCLEMEEKSISELNSFLFTPTPVKLNHHNKFQATDSTTQTPMLPPKSVPRKITSMRTPSSTTKYTSTHNMPFASRMMVSTPIEEELSGRASIARLRAQNAGMVMAKAKLFDELGGGNTSEINSQVVHEQNWNLHNERNKSVFATPSRAELNARNMISNPVNENVKSVIQLHNSSRRIIATNSPSSNKNRQRSRLYSKNDPCKLKLHEFANDVALVQPKITKQTRIMKNINETNGNSAYVGIPRTPNLRHHLNTNSPRRARQLNSKIGAQLSQTSIRNGVDRNLQRCNKPKPGARKQ